jgi:hypothetical protein
MIGAGGHRPGGADVYDEIALDEAPAGVGVVPWVKRAVIGVGVVAFLVLSSHYLLLDHTATRGDVPDAADMRFPAGAVVVATEKHCRGESCWSTFYVAPPPRMTATELNAEIEAASVGGILGSFTDPRFVNAMTTLNGSTVHVIGRYW